MDERTRAKPLVSMRIGVARDSNQALSAATASSSPSHAMNSL